MQNTAGQSGIPRSNIFRTGQKMKTVACMDNLCIYCIVKTLFITRIKMADTCTKQTKHKNNSYISRNRKI